MRHLHTGGCLLGLVLAAVPARATFVQFRMPIPDLVAGSDLVVIAKVNRIHKNFITALPTRQAAKKEYYQLVEVTVKETIQGAKSASRITLGVQCFGMKLGGGPLTVTPAVKWTEGQEACFFLKRHFSGKFYEAGFENVLRKEAPLGGNPNYNADLELARKCARLLASADKSLKSDKGEDRFLTAAMLIRKYRGPALSPFEMNKKVKKPVKEEPISPEQSKLIVKALAEADWSLAKEPFASQNHPAGLFRRLGLTAKDGWTLRQTPANPLDGRANYKLHVEFTAAAKKWLKAHAATYRIKRIVEGQEKSTSAQEKSRRDSEKRISRDRKKPKTDAPRRDRDKVGEKSLRAAAKLRLIKSLLEAGKTEAGKFRLQQLIKDYPNTPAAKEAKKLLKGLE
jgi:hypothetical protein